MTKTYYDILGVSQTASTQQIKHAYRRLIQDHHPDKAGYDSEQVLVINEAYQTLKDPQKRQVYDQSIRGLQFGKQVFRVFRHFQDAVEQNFKENWAFLRPHTDESQFDDYIKVWVYPWQAVFGDKIAVKTQFHHLLVPMPAFADVLSLTIKGAGKPKTDGSFGDLFIDFAIKVPSQQMNDAQKHAFEALAKLYLHKNY